MSESTDLVLPGTGELVDLSDTPACVAALDALRNYESLIREAKATLTRALIEEATRQGVRSIELPNGDRAEVSPAFEIVWDAELLEQRLRDAGMPEERISQIIEQTVTLKVKTGEAKKAAAANPDYAEAVQEARLEQPKPQYVTIRKR